MKHYELYDGDLGRSVGTLLSYEKDKNVIIELEDNLDEWTAPFLFATRVKKGVFTMPRDLSMKWIRERVIPSGRQNIAAILRNYNLKEYDEMKLLELSGGHSSQDAIVLRKQEELPEYVRQRMQRNVTGVFPTGERSLVCFFADETMRKIDLNTLSDLEDVEKVLRNEELFRSVTIGSGGYYISFGNTIDLPAAVLYEAGVEIPLTRDDFVSFAQNNIVDTTEAGILLDCSRQNLSYLIRKQKLTPVKTDTGGNLYLKEDVLKTNW
jgi:hypothetical protein